MCDVCVCVGEECHPSPDYKQDSFCSFFKAFWSKGVFLKLLRTPSLVWWEQMWVFNCKSSSYDVTDNMNSSRYKKDTLMERSMICYQTNWLLLRIRNKKFRSTSIFFPIFNCMECTKIIISSRQLSSLLLVAKWALIKIANLSINISIKRRACLGWSAGQSDCLQRPTLSDKKSVTAHCYAGTSSSSPTSSISSVSTL